MMCGNSLIQFMSHAGGRVTAMPGPGRCKVLARRELEREDAVREEILGHLGNGRP